MHKGRMAGLLGRLHPYMILKGLRYLRHFGWKGFWTRLRERLEPEEVPYGPWYEAYRPTKEELEQQRKQRLAGAPSFGILVPCYHTPPAYLREMIESVRLQTYENWHLYLADASGDDASMEEILAEYEQMDSRIRVIRLLKNKGIAENTNAALFAAEDDFVAFLDHDDCLSQAALWQMARYLLAHPETRLLYTDEDKISADGKTHFRPHLKPDFNLDLLRSNNYICHFLAVDRQLACALGGLRNEYDGAQDYDFIFRCLEKAAGLNVKRMGPEVAGHVPEILYHWRVHAKSTADNPQSKAFAYEAGRRAIADHLQRCHVPGTVFMEKDPGFYRVKYPAQKNTKISIIIPNKDHSKLLRQCLQSVWDTTGRSEEGWELEVLVVENGSEEEETFACYKELAGRKEVRILRWESGFNYSAINNFAARQASGDFLLFLNNDIRAFEEGWLEEMLGVCSREDVGIVGARLYYPDDTIQHAGIVVGIGGVAGSLFVGMKREFTGYLHKAALLQDLSAVTAACMMVRRSVFEQAGGFEEKLAVAFNDVDFCLRVKEAGYRVVYDPYVQLYHEESKTRGPEDTKEKVRRFQKEIEYMRGRWTSLLKNGDPCYNKNLSLAKWNYSLRPDERMR